MTTGFDELGGDVLRRLCLASAGVAALAVPFVAEPPCQLGFAGLSLLLRAAQEMLEKGSFTWKSDVSPSSELHRFLGASR